MENTLQKQYLPVSPKWAFAVLGWMIGTFPSTAFIFLTSLKGDLQNIVKAPAGVPYGVLVFIPTLVLCSIIGLGMGFLIGWVLSFAREKRWLAAATSPFTGAIWAVITGGLGCFIGMFLTVFVATMTSGKLVNNSVFESLTSALLLSFFIALIGFWFGAICALPFGIVGFVLFSVPYSFVRGSITTNISYAWLLASVVTFVLINVTALLLLAPSFTRR